jgi:hypothetical protein
MAEHPGFAFQVAHAAFALAACEDHAGLTMISNSSAKFEYTLFGLRVSEM